MRTRIESARLYAICDVAQLERMPIDALDVLQLREKHIRGAALRDAAAAAAARCRTAGTIFILNDDPELAAAVDADGVHLGQDDMDYALARAIVGPERLIGLSTHTPAQIDAAGHADYIGVGPVFATPTKPGREPVGLELVRYAAAHARVPFFAIGGIDARNVGGVRSAGARGIAVVRAITDAADPVGAVESLREEAPVGTA